jgi:hypothetical protein
VTSTETASAKRHLRNVFPVAAHLARNDPGA